MELIRGFWWMVTTVGVVSAFSSNLPCMSHSQLQLKNYDSPIPFMIREISSSGEQRSTLQHTMELSAKKSPHPPDFTPRIDEQLELDLIESERRVMLYEKEVEMIREQLGLKQSELLEEQNVFRDEKRTLMKKIAEFTTVLAQRDTELESALKRDKSKNLDAVMQKELENTILSLETQLQEKTDSLENEKKSSEELRKRFDDAEDALEFEQMNFEKERRLLQELVTNERKQVKALQETFEEDNKSFEVIREELLRKIQGEEEKLSDTKAKWRVTQERLRQVEEKLETSLKEKAQLLKETRMNTDTETAMSEEIMNLQNQIKLQEAEMEQIKNGLNGENENSKSAIESKIETEERLINELQQGLSEEKKKYENKKSTLDQEISNINANLADVETQLANEQAKFSKEKEMLEKKLANEIRVGRLKKKQMKRRYDEIRREMTDLWESSKRQARQEECRLRKKYERKIDTVKAQIAKLEMELITEKNRQLVEQEEMQLRQSEELKIRDETILELEVSVTNLGKLIAYKDKIIKEKEEQIQLYETSFRQVAKLGLIVTGKKIKKVAGPLKRLIQNSPPSDDIIS